MTLSDPRFIYMLSVLPIILGITLVGDGISKLIHEKYGGWVSLTTGLTFLMIAGLILVTSK